MHATQTAAVTGTDYKKIVQKKVKARVDLDQVSVTAE